jgi:hypothetical protein
MFNYLKAYVDKRPRPDAEEVVAFALLCVDRAAGEEARGPLQSLAPVSLSEIILQVPVSSFRRPMLRFFKYFRQKIQRKNWRF